MKDLGQKKLRKKKRSELNVLDIEWKYLKSNETFVSSNNWLYQHVDIFTEDVIF